MWSYITFGDPANLYHPLPPESDKPGWQAPGGHPGRSITTGTNQVRSPRAAPSHPNAHTPACTDCPPKSVSRTGPSGTVMHLPTAVSAAPSNVPTECEGPLELAHLSLNVTVQRGRYTHTHTHRQFRPYTHPALSENSIWAPQALLSLRNPPPACQGVCTLNDHMRPYRGPVFIASTLLNPLQQCVSPAVRGVWRAAPAAAPDSCTLILCAFCATFLVQCHGGSMRSMLRWWRSWLEKRPAGLCPPSGFWANTQPRSASGPEQEARRWNFTWSCLREARWELGMDLDAEV